jgi:hypothetical protein
VGHFEHLCRVRLLISAVLAENLGNRPMARAATPARRSLREIAAAKIVLNPSPPPKILCRFH